VTGNVKKLTETEYNRLKAAGIPIEDVIVEGSWAVA
jgi:hypothetical protein